VEDEVRDILRVALAAGENDHRSLVEAIRARFAPLGGVELHIPPREAIRTVPELDE
jgi:plasmid stability protein